MFLNYFFFLVPSSIVYFQRFLGSSYIHAHCFCLIGLISGPGSVGASLAECSMSRMKFTREESRKKWAAYCVKKFLGDPLCHVATWDFTSRRQKSHLSVTSRRGISRRDVKLTPLCHVATCIFTSRHQIVHSSVTSRRHPARRDVIFTCLCHVAT